MEKQLLKKRSKLRKKSKHRRTKKKRTNTRRRNTRRRTNTRRRNTRRRTNTRRRNTRRTHGIYKMSGGRWQPQRPPPPPLDEHEISDYSIPQYWDPNISYSTIIAPRNQMLPMGASQGGPRDVELSGKQGDQAWYSPSFASRMNDVDLPEASRLRHQESLDGKRSKNAEDMMTYINGTAEGADPPHNTGITEWNEEDAREVYRMPVDDQKEDKQGGIAFFIAKKIWYLHETQKEIVGNCVLCSPVVIPEKCIEGPIQLPDISKYTEECVGCMKRKKHDILCSFYKLPRNYTTTLEIQGREKLTMEGLEKKAALETKNLELLQGSDYERFLSNLNQPRVTPSNDFLTDEVKAMVKEMSDILYQKPVDDKLIGHLSILIEVFDTLSAAKHAESGLLLDDVEKTHMYIDFFNVIFPLEIIHGDQPCVIHLGGLFQKLGIQNIVLFSQNLYECYDATIRRFSTSDDERSRPLWRDGKNFAALAFDLSERPSWAVKKDDIGVVEEIVTDKGRIEIFTKT